MSVRMVYPVKTDQDGIDNIQNSNGYNNSFVQLEPVDLQMLTSVNLNTPGPQPPSSSYQCNQGMFNNQLGYDLLTLPGSLASFSAFQLQTPRSGLPQDMAQFNNLLPEKYEEKTLCKRELRLMKNREAAKNCRRKKKEYIICLENQLAILEKQNKALIEEITALKKICRHNVERIPPMRR